MNVATTEGRGLTYSAGMNELVKTSSTSVGGGTSVTPTEGDERTKRDAWALGFEQSGDLASSAGPPAPPDWTEAWPEIQARICARRHLLLALSFDGILCPTALRPNEATLPQDVRELLSKLANSLRVTLAIVSGRSLSDLEDRVAIPAAFYVGNHGMQIRGPEFFCSDGLAVSCRADLVDARALLTKCAKRLQGVLIEDKGLTIAVHWRLASSEERTKLRELLEIIVQRHPRLEMIEGEACWELRARASWDKPEALHQILSHLRLTTADAVYVGERFTGGKTFSDLSEALTFCIGWESPTAARYSLHSPSDVGQLLFRIFYTVNGTQPQ